MKVSAVALANAGSHWLEACYDVEAYLPPDDSDGWPDFAIQLLEDRERYEEDYKALIKQAIEFGIEDDV